MKGKKLYSLKEIFQKNFISKTRSGYICSKCNILHDTPFQAYACYKECNRKEIAEYWKDPINLYWHCRTAEEKRSLRNEFNSNDTLYQSYKSVAEYAYIKYKKGGK